VAATVSASGAWNYYKGGVYNECNSNGTNHIVAIVGWDDSTQSWILKNSHGTGWGEEGFMHIKYTDEYGYKCNRIGETAAFVVYKP
jgi:C1A family cysteine protease